MPRPTATPRPDSRLLLVPLLACLAGAACSQPVELVGRLGSRRVPITGGTVYGGHPSVGRLSNGGNGQCTATLIGARTVITAAHCIDGGPVDFTLDTGERIAATKAVRHPDWAGDGADHDIAVVVLARAPALRPSAISTKPPTVGLPIVLIGYGVTMCSEIPGSNPMQLSCTNDANIKRRAENRVAALQNGVEFSYEGRGSTCKGDSGGPAFATIDGREVLLGVTSRGTMPCGTRGVDTRLDVFRDWIAQVAGGDVNIGRGPTVQITAPANHTTLPAGSVTVTATVAEGRVAHAELLVDGTPVASASAAPFAFGVELSAGSHQLKVVAEDAMGNTGDASVAITVVAGSGAFGPVGPRGFGSECGAPGDCASGICARDGDTGRNYCTALCEPSKADACPGSADCMPTVQGAHVCAPQLVLGAPGFDRPLLVGGCALGATARAVDALPLPLLLLLVLVLRRRRSSR